LIGLIRLRYFLLSSTGNQIVRVPPSKDLDGHVLAMQLGKLFTQTPYATCNFARKAQAYAFVRNFFVAAELEHQAFRAN
jgi:hypothetical protein